VRGEREQVFPHGVAHHPRDDNPIRPAPRDAVVARERDALTAEPNHRSRVPRPGAFALPHTFALDPRGLPGDEREAGSDRGAAWDGQPQCAGGIHAQDEPAGTPMTDEEHVVGFARDRDRACASFRRGAGSDERQPELHDVNRTGSGSRGAR
jgi:hypothetical protein